jgi:O-antigen chain-terminating methyltransferase
MSEKIYPVKILAAIYRLPRYIKLLENIENKADSNSKKISQITTNLESIDQKLKNIEKLDTRISDLRSYVSSMNIGTRIKEKKVNDTVSDNHSLDLFYKKFEDKFRGSEEDIKNRVKEHLNLFNSLPEKNKKMPVVDIGCGRGEFLSVMSENNFNVIGVDMNKAMVERANDLGYKAVESDALTYLNQQKSNDLAAVTGFHIVEHIPFDVLISIFEECYRVLANGGFVLFETPNPNTLNVGANTFYLDPSHQRPIPAPLLEFMLQYVGFETEIIYIHKIKEIPKNTPKNIQEIIEKIYGYADYAVVGKKNI